MQREDIKMLIEKWWDIYRDESLDYKGLVPVEGEEGRRQGMITESGVVHYIPAPSAA